MKRLENVIANLKSAGYADLADKISKIAEAHWEYREADKHTSALSYWKDYVISHRPGNFTLSFRPPDTHKHLGNFPSLEEAKRVAEEHASKNVTAAGPEPRAKMLLKELMEIKERLKSIPEKSMDALKLNKRMTEIKVELAKAQRDGRL